MHPIRGQYKRWQSKIEASYQCFKLPYRLELVDMVKAPEVLQPPSSSSIPSAEATTTTKPSAALKSKPLYRLLDYLLPCLKKRDTNSFFALPVEDKFAPGYSQIIKQV